jgi:hypothetical protein
MSICGDIDGDFKDDCNGNGNGDGDGNVDDDGVMDLLTNL